MVVFGRRCVFLCGQAYFFILVSIGFACPFLEYLFVVFHQVGRSGEMERLSEVVLCKPFVRGVWSWCFFGVLLKMVWTMLGVG